MAKKEKSKEANLEHFAFFKELKTGNKFADMTTQNVATMIDTGCYVFNAIYSGDMTIGFPSDKILMLAGEESVGKTFFTILGHALPLQKQDNRFIFYFDTENAITEEFLINFGLDPAGFRIIRESTVEECRKTMANLLDTIEAQMKSSTKNKFKCAFILDSLGQLSTLKSMEDSSDGNFKRDFTKQTELKKLFAVLTTRMGLLDIPMVMTNHVYKMIASAVPMNEVSGGSGALYASSVILELKKRQFKDGKTRTGSIIIAKARKSRMIREGQQVSFYLDFVKGLNKWYGVHLLATDAGLLEEWAAKHDKAGIAYPEIPARIKEPKVFVIKDPTKPMKEWIACLEKDLHKESTIGTIFEPINEWVKANFKLSKATEQTGEEAPEQVDEALDVEED